MELKLKNNNKLKFNKNIILLDYIEVSGGSFNITIPNKTIALNEKFVWKFKSGSSLGLGWQNQDQNDEYQIFIYANQFYFDYRGRINGGTFTSNTEYYLEIGNKYIKNLTTGTNIISGNSVTQNVTPKDFSVGTTNRFYFFKDYVGDELIHELLPVIYNDIVCVYDTISDTFFYNISVGTVVAGPESETQPYKVFPDDTTLKITSIFHQNTPNVNALSLIKSVVNYQKTHQDEVVLLNRIRADIGNVEGPIFDLLELAGMAGFNDNYEPQAKPRLVGTYTINDWYTQDQLAEAQAAFDGLTIVPDPNYVIDFSQLAVQTLDDTQPNYNPAVAIILQAAGYGNTLSAPPISGQTGRWLLLKSKAQLIKDISNIAEKNIVTDTNGIVSSDITATYEFDTFNEFQYFTGITSIYGKNDSRKTRFYNCTKLKSIIFPSSITTIYPNNPPFDYSGCFANCTSLKNVEVSENLTDIGNGAFYNCKNLRVLHLTHYCSISTQSGHTIESNTKVYVGNGISESDDNTLLNEFLSDSKWSQYFSSNLDTWYNYLHPSA